jgi:hypothetical protein
VTRSFREDWIFLEPIEGKPGRAIRRLKVEHQAEYSRLQKELVRLQEMRAELRRELNLDLGEMYGT